eukprot:COSAG04_NODE_21_length_38435_cov_79.510382_18_plen_52_part_00
MYIYSTIDKLGWRWKELDGIAPRKSISEACATSGEPGANTPYSYDIDWHQS